MASSAWRHLTNLHCTAGFFLILTRSLQGLLSYFTMVVSFFSRSAFDSQGSPFYLTINFLPLSLSVLLFFYILAVFVPPRHKVSTTFFFKIYELKTGRTCRVVSSQRHSNKSGLWRAAGKCDDIPSGGNTLQKLPKMPGSWLVCCQPLEAASAVTNPFQCVPR